MEEETRLVQYLLDVYFTRNFCVTLSLICGIEGNGSRRCEISELSFVTSRSLSVAYSRLRPSDLVKRLSSPGAWQSVLSTLHWTRSQAKLSKVSSQTECSFFFLLFSHGQNRSIAYHTSCWRRLVSFNAN